MKRISLLGAGWLGAPLAKQLKEQGHHIKVSVTSGEKANLLEQQGVHSVVVRLGHPHQEAALQQLLEDTDLLIITIPPARAKQSVEGSYIDKIKSLIPFIEQHNIPELMFTSSTTVYMSQHGVVDESTVLHPTSDMDQQIYTIEQMLLRHPGFNATILRLGALIGEERHPVRYIVQRPLVEDANNPVNMIHQTDIIRFIKRMIEEPLPNEVFNMVAPILKSRREFYTEEANALQLSPLPVFSDNPAADLRRVKGDKIVQRYGMAYEWLGSI